MRIVIVYESSYGNTHLVADAVAEGCERGTTLRSCRYLKPARNSSMPTCRRWPDPRPRHESRKGSPAELRPRTRQAAD
jgi:hypothetical protein